MGRRKLDWRKVWPKLGHYILARIGAWRVLEYVRDWWHMGMSFWGKRELGNVLIPFKKAHDDSHNALLPPVLPLSLVITRVSTPSRPDPVTTQPLFLVRLIPLSNPAHPEQ